MTENEYIAATNLANARMAMNIVQDITTGFDGVTTQEEKADVMHILYDWVDGLAAKVKIDK